MRFFRIAIFSILLFIVQCCHGENQYRNKLVVSNEDVGEFLVSFMHHFRWGCATVLTDINANALLKQLSMKFAPVSIQPVNTNFHIARQFRTIIFINSTQTAFTVLTNMLVRSYTSPQNWLMITEGESFALPSLFIPHEFNVIFAVPQSDNRIKLLRVYSKKIDVLSMVTLGYWQVKERILRVKFVPIPLPSLTDKVFRVSTSHFPPHFGPKYLQPDKPDGILGEILHSLKIAANFTYTVKQPADKQYGSKLNSTHFSGMVGQLVANEADIAVALTMSAERSLAVGYSHLVSKVTIKFIYRNRELTRWRFFFFGEPFSLLLWISISGVGLLVVFIFVTIHEISSILQHTRENERSRRRSSIKDNNIFARFSTFAWYIQFSYYTLLGTGYNLHMAGTSGKIVLQVFHLFSFMLYIQYTTVLTSILTVDIKPSPFRSLDELFAKSDYQAGTLLGTSAVEYYKTAESGVNLKVWQSIQKNPDLYLAKTIQTGIDLVYADKYAFIMEGISLATLIQNNCSLEFGEEIAYEIHMAFAYRKGFRYKKIFDKYLLILLENGVAKKTREKHNPPDHNKACKQRELKGGLKRHSIVGLFAVMICAIVLSVLVLGVEIFLSKSSAH